MTDIKQNLQKYIDLLPIGTSVSYTEAERRASDFLVALSIVTDVKHMLSGEKIKLLSVQTATYAEQMSKGTAKTVTENKLTAEASPEYAKSREELESIDNDISYLRAYYEIFTNGHLFYRQLCKENK